MNRSIILAAIIISAAILLNGYLNRANRAPQVAHSAQKAVPSVRDKSIAVLPFENLNNDPQTVDFADGIQQEIITRLTKVHDLKVVSHDDLIEYKPSSARNLRDIAHRFGIANVLEGSAQQAGDRVRVTVQLIEATRDVHLWAQRYDRELGDLPAIETAIAEAVAEELGAKPSSAERAAIEEGRGNR